MDTQHCEKIFEHYGGMMRTKELGQEKIYYKNIQQLIEAGCVEKVRYGYYQWINPDDFSKIGTVSCLFPDAIVKLISSFLEKELQAKEAAEAVLDQIDLMKKSILACAFRGELGTNDPTEESAVELLKKIIQ